MANAREIIEGLGKRLSETEQTQDELSRSHTELSGLIDARMETLEQTVFMLLSGQLDALRGVLEATEDEAAREQITETAAMWSQFQAQVSPRVFARTYRINPYTGENLDDAGLEKFLTEPRVFTHPGD